MSKLHSMRKRLQPRRIATAKMMAKLQALEGDPKKLRENFPEVFERLVTQKTVEVFAPAGGPSGE